MTAATYLPTLSVQTLGRLSPPQNLNQINMLDSNPNWPRYGLRRLLVSSLLLWMLLVGSPPSVAAQTCAEDSTAVNNRGAALAGDCTALLGLKDTLRGTATLNWATTEDMSNWDGITVAGTPDRVTGLSLISKSLTGTIPSTLGNLSALVSLLLYDNQLTGTIPSTLGNLSALKYLGLSNNQLTGTIPSTLGNLTNLTELDLRNNPTHRHHPVHIRHPAPL